MMAPVIGLWGAWPNAPLGPPLSPAEDGQKVRRPPAASPSGDGHVTDDRQPGHVTLVRVSRSRAGQSLGGRAKVRARVRLWTVLNCLLCCDAHKQLLYSN